MWLLWCEPIKLHKQECMTGWHEIEEMPLGIVDDTEWNHFLILQHSTLKIQYICENKMKNDIAKSHFWWSQPTLGDVTPHFRWVSSKSLSFPCHACHYGSTDRYTVLEWWNIPPHHKQWQVLVKQTAALRIFPLTGRLIKGLSVRDGFCRERFEICFNIPSRCSYLGLRRTHPPMHGQLGVCEQIREWFQRGGVWMHQKKKTFDVLHIEWNDVGSNRICKALFKMKLRT